MESLNIPFLISCIQSKEPWHTGRVNGLLFFFSPEAAFGINDVCFHLVVFSFSVIMSEAGLHLTVDASQVVAINTYLYQHRLQPAVISSQIAFNEL